MIYGGKETPWKIFNPTTGEGLHAEHIERPFDFDSFPKQGDGAFDFLAEEERASKHAKGRLDPGFNEQQMAVLEDAEVLVGQRDAEINNIGMCVILGSTWR